MSHLVLLSGGMDSATALALALLPSKDAETLAVNYGQRHIKELDAAAAIAAHYGVRHDVLDLTSYGHSVRSALTSDVALPTGHYADDTMAATVVPNRNATMLAAAAGIAADRGHNHVVIAVHAGDHPVYADCRPEFINALSAALTLGCGVDVVAPFVQSTKTDIARVGANLGVPFGLTWSCYAGGEAHCGRCGTCVERAEAFRDAGIPDPTTYDLETPV